MPEETEIIRRISREFASGKSPKTVAVDLSKEGIPGPLGRAWGDTSNRGHRTRGTGIVNNELYAGVLVWNRLTLRQGPEHLPDGTNSEGAFKLTSSPCFSICF